jgi:hypothetical protein
MSGIMSMFSNILGNGGTPTPAVSNGTQAPAPTPGNIPANTPNTGVANQNTAPNGAVPNSGDMNPKPDATPLDQFSELWKNEPTDPNAPAKTGIFGDVDPKKFMEAAGKIDFSKVVTPEQLQAISAGGEGAMASFAQALNAVAQSTYAQSAFASTKIVEQAMARAKDSFIAELPQHIKKQTVSDSLRNENPVFANPAVQPIISALEAQLTVKYPSASAGEITTMAKQYVEALGTSFSPKPAAPTPQKGQRDETDWSKFLE